MSEMTKCIPLDRMLEAPQHAICGRGRFVWQKWLDLMSLSQTEQPSVAWHHAVAPCPDTTAEILGVCC